MAASQTLSLKGRALKLDTAADVEKHIQPLKEDITEIILEGNTIGIEAAATLADLIAKHSSTLQIANLADIFTGRLLSEIPTALDSLLKALLKCEKLHTVNLNDNAFGLNTVEPLRPFLSQCVSLQHLFLNNNGLGPAAGSLVAQSLEQLAEKKQQARTAGGRDVPHLETVVCGRNRLETGSMAAWSKAYTANSHVRTVKMVQNGIRQEGITMLLRDGLSKCSQLQILDLQDNTFTSVASRTLSATLARWPEMRDLGVGDCLLSARGGRLVGEALLQGKNTKLEVLRLQFNEIDATGVKAICDAAASEKAMPRLRRVELNGNKFSEEDSNVEKLQELLSERKSSADLEKDYPGVDPDDEDAWGLDELDELEDDDEDEDEDEVEADEDEDAEERVVKEADQAEDEPVSQKKDKDVDELAEALGKTELK